MDFSLLRFWVLLLSISVLTACQVAPVAQDKAKSSIVAPAPVEDIYRQLRSEKALERVQALQSLAKQPILARKSISLILVLLGDDRQVDVAKYVGSGFYSGSVSSPADMAAELLAKLGRWSVLPLRLRLHDKNPIVRQYATKSLGIIAKPEHAEWLLSGLADIESAVSKEAYAALLKQDAQVYVRLINELDFSSMSLRQQLLIIQLLGNSQHGDALPMLFKFAANSNSTLRSASFAALSKFPEAKLEDIVLQGIEDKAMHVKENALMLAPYHRSEEVLAAVIRQLSVDDDNVSQVALKVLPIISGEKQRSINAWQQWWQARLLKH